MACRSVWSEALLQTSSCPTRYQHFLFKALFSTPVKLRFCLSTGAQGSPDDFVVCVHLIVVRNLAHSGNPHDQARSSAVCPFLLHKPIWASLATRRLRHSRLPTFAALWSGVSPKTSCWLRSAPVCSCQRRKQARPPPAARWTGDCSWGSGGALTDAPVSSKFLRPSSSRLQLSNSIAHLKQMTGVPGKCGEATRAAHWQVLWNTSS